jgi:hypothetical protein
MNSIKQPSNPNKLPKTKRAGIAVIAAASLLAACSSDKAPVSAEKSEVVTTATTPEVTIPATTTTKVPQKGGPGNTLPSKGGPGEVVNESESLKNYSEYLRSAERTERIREEIENATQQLVDNALQAENISVYSSGDLMNDPYADTVANSEGFLRIEGFNQIGTDVQYTIYGNYTQDGSGVSLPDGKYFDPVTFMANTTTAGEIYPDEYYTYDSEVVILGNSTDPESYITGYMLPEGNVVNDERVVFHRASETGVSVGIEERSGSGGKGGEAITSPDQLRDFDAEVFEQMHDIVQQVN